MLFSVTSRGGATRLVARERDGMFEYEMEDGSWGQYKTLESLRDAVRIKIALGYFGKQYKIEGEL